MKKGFLIALAAVALLAASCVKQAEETVVPVSGFPKITATTNGGPATKVSVGEAVDGVRALTWDKGDALSVFYRSSIPMKYVLEGEGGEASGVFGYAAGAGGGPEFPLVYAAYPYDREVKYEDGALWVTVPPVQAYTAGGFDPKANVMVGAADPGANLYFKNVGGYLVFQFWGEDAEVSKVTVSGAMGEYLAGQVLMGVEDGYTPWIEEWGEGSEEVSLVCNPPVKVGATADAATEFWLVVMPQTLMDGFTVTVEWNGGTFSQTMDASYEVVRSKVNRLSPLELNSFSPDDPIAFKDADLKAHLIECGVDTNDDGEISYAEAAAATSLSGLFTDWNTVTSFDEIRYFTGVTSTSGVFDGLSNLKSITIPEFITTLGSFRNCTSLESVVLPSGLTSLPSSCFDGCRVLSDITLPDGITAIPNFCFRECDSLNTLALPSGVTSIGNKAFDGCDALVGVEMPSGLRSIGGAAFQNCGALSSVTLSSGLVSIGSYAFSNCTALGSIAIPSGVNLGAYAFNGCSSLMTVSLPSYLPSLPNYCFQNCTALASIAFPDNLQSIGQYAFSGCSFAGNNYSLELPSTVTTIGDHAFGNLRHLIIPSNTPVTIAANSFVKDYTYLYVPADMVEMYKSQTNWSEYADRIRPIGDYPVSVIEAVDLGLSVKWASCNVGALDSSGYGDYFAWGETATKTDYSWSTYLDSPNRDGKSFTKYFTGEGGKATLVLEDDAAHVNWGGTWRMPTDAEWTELRTGCTWTWTSRNGVSGSLVTAPNGNSIFLPAAGLWYVSMLYNADSFGNYWSSSLYTGSPENTWTVKIGSGEFSRSLIHRYYGLSVRPVTE